MGTLFKLQLSKIHLVGRAYLDNLDLTLQLVRQMPIQYIDSYLLYPYGCDDFNHCFRFQLNQVKRTHVSTVVCMYIHVLVLVLVRT